jgi:hypothetical protein
MASRNKKNSQTALRSSNQRQNNGKKYKSPGAGAPPGLEPADRGRWTRRAFPRNALEDALSIPIAIKDKTNGNPCDTDPVARAVGLSKSSGKFFYLCSSARDYGLIVGSRDTPKIALDDLGRAIAFAADPASRRLKQIEAFFRIDKFKKVFDFYGGSNGMPEGEFVGNVLLGQFDLDISDHAEFIELFKKNCEFLGIADGSDGVSRVSGANDKHDAVDIRIVGQPRGKFDRTAFVIMPFSEKGSSPRAKGFFDEVLKSLIAPAGNAAGFAVETARRDGSDIIHHTIINQLIQAELVIADLTDHNPSVLFELGIRDSSPITTSNSLYPVTRVGFTNRFPRWQTCFLDSPNFQALTQCIQRL